MCLNLFLEITLCGSIIVNDYLPLNCRIWVISYGRTDCITVSESVQICGGRVRVPGPFLPTTPLTFVQRLGVLQVAINPTTVTLDRCPLRFLTIISK